MTESLIATITAKVDNRGPQQILDDWRKLIEEERLCEKSCLKHGMPDQSKWHEGKADAIERCADEFEYLVLKKLAKAILEDTPRGSV